VFLLFIVQNKHNVFDLYRVILSVKTSVITWQSIKELRKEFHIEINVCMLQNFSCRMQFVRAKEPVLVRNVHCIVKILNNIQ